MLNSASRILHICTNLFPTTLVEYLEFSIHLNLNILWKWYLQYIFVYFRVLYYMCSVLLYSSLLQFLDFCMPFGNSIGIILYFVFHLCFCLQFDKILQTMVMEAPPSPQSVGREFVRQYYTLMHQAPSHLHR